jgi:hypothetical protein
LVCGFAVLSYYANIVVHVRYLQRDAVYSVGGVGGIAARLRWVHAGLGGARTNSSRDFDFVVELFVEFVADSFQNVEKAGLVFDHDVVSALRVEASANRGGSGCRRVCVSA